MPLDSATKAYLDEQFSNSKAQFNELLAKFDQQSAELARSNELCEALAAEVSTLKLKLQTAESELEKYKANSVQDFTNTQVRCDSIEEVCTKLREDLLAQTKITGDQSVEIDSLQIEVR